MQVDEHDLPVCRVQGHGVDLDKNIVVPHLREWNFLHLSFTDTHDFDGLHSLG